MVGLEEEERLDPVAAFDELGADARWQRPLVLWTPELGVVTVEHRRNAALVPVHGQQHVERTPGALHVAIERGPEPLLVLCGDERIDDHHRVGQLRIDRADLRPPVLGVIPLRVLTRPPPEARPQLVHVHPQNLPL